METFDFVILRARETGLFEGLCMRIGTNKTQIIILDLKRTLLLGCRNFFSLEYLGLSLGIEVKEKATWDPLFLEMEVVV